MDPSPQPHYEPSEWTTRQTFVRLLNEACAAHNATLSWSSENWVAHIQKGNVTTIIYGYTFPLNNAAVAGVLRDKSATYQVLAAASVPAIPHFLLRLPALRSVEGAAAAAQKLAPLPLVVKPNMGESGGFDVTHCQTTQELDAALRNLASRHQNLAVSPFVQIAREFRVVMLAGEPLLAFEKVRGPHEWRHNLRLGAAPGLVGVDASAELTALARRALHATGAELAAVDIAETPDGYKIMEINGGISLGSFAGHSTKNFTLALEAYMEILEKSLD